MERVQVSQELLFRGRPGDPRIGEWVVSVPPGGTAGTVPKGRETVSLYGCPDDLGVKRNRGRAGAKEGPDAIRRHLYRIALPMDLAWESRLELRDYGNIVVDEDIRQTHQRAASLAAELAEAGHTVIALGGGHDFAAPNFRGFVQGRKQRKAGERSALINVDPHLDVREWEDGLPHSGTPFRTLLDTGALTGPRFVEFGIRANRNSREHYNYCRARKVSVITLEQIRAGKPPVEQQLRSWLNRLRRSAAVLGVTFDMDSCAETEGISAAPVLGFSAWEMYRMAEVAGAIREVRYFEIAEVAPSLDYAERSARIAAEMIYGFLRSRAVALGAKPVTQSRKSP